MFTGSLLIAASVLCSVSGQQSGWWENTNRLHKDLLDKDKYNVNVMPTPVKNHTTKVLMGIKVRGIYLDDKDQTLTLNSWFVMVWHDRRLTWDHKDYGGLKDTTFDMTTVWRPDLLVYNSAEPTKVDHYGKTPVFARSSGIVYWVPPTQTRTECPMDITYWPFDSHTCSIILGSWSTDGFQLDFDTWMNDTSQLLEDKIQMSHHWHIDEAQLVRNVIKYDNIDEPYVSMILKLRLSRNSPSFSSTVTVPAVVVALVCLVQFSLPVDYPPRISVGLAATGLSVFMAAVLGATIPPLGSSTPLIVQYYAMTMILCVLSVAMSGLLARLSKEQLAVLSWPPPLLLKRVLTGPLATVLCVRSIADQVGLSSSSKEGNDEEVLADRGRSYQHEWLLVAVVVDRLLQLAYCVVFFLGLLVFTSKLH